jgi:hypothetical protein
VTAEGAVVSRGPVPMRPRRVRSFRGKSGGGKGKVDVDEYTRVVGFEGLAPSDGTESGGVYIWTRGKCGGGEEGERE